MLLMLPLLPLPPRVLPVSFLGAVTGKGSWRLCGVVCFPCMMPTQLLSASGLCGVGAQYGRLSTLSRPHAQVDGLSHPGRIRRRGIYAADIEVPPSLLRY